MSYTQEYDPYVSGDSGIGTSMSVLLALNTGVYAQIGWNKHKSGSSFVREVFSDFRDGWGHAYWNTWSGQSVGTYTNYEVTFVSSTDHFLMWVNGSNYLNMGANWTPASYQVFSETQDTADQMPGGYNSGSHAYFVSTWYNNGSGWLAPSGDTVHYYTPTSYAQKVGSQEYDTWDLKCPS
jgi:hypothetical protein